MSYLDDIPEKQLGGGGGSRTRVQNTFLVASYNHNLLYNNSYLLYNLE
jgi:hypothetical protein